MIDRCMLTVVTLLSALALGGCDDGSSPSAAPAPSGPTPIDQPQAPSQLAEYDSLHDVMEDIGRAYQYLERNVAKAGNDAELLERIAQMRQLVEMAGRMTPEQVEQAPEAKRAQIEAAFHEHLAAVPPLLDELAAAVASGDRGAAQALVTKLHDAQHAGHEALGVEEH